MTPKRDTVSPAMAAVHLACAHALLAGYKAYLAGEGLHYDMIIDDRGRLFRVQVKATSKPVLRPGRSTPIKGYWFQTARNHRPEKLGERAKVKFYDHTMADIFCCVALDTHRMGFIAVSGRFPQAIWFYDEATPSFHRKGMHQRRHFSDFPLKASIETSVRRIEKGPDDYAPF